MGKRGVAIDVKNTLEVAESCVSASAIASSETSDNPYCVERKQLCLEVTCQEVSFLKNAQIANDSSGGFCPSAHEELMRCAWEEFDERIEHKHTGYVCQCE